MNITDLIERLEKAEGPDRQLDYGIFCAFADHEGFNFWLPDAGHMYTSSVDAAIALAEKVLPGWGHQVGRPTQLYRGHGYYASVFEGNGIFYHDYDTPQGGRVRPADSYRPNGAIALCIAILKAKQQRVK